MATDKPRHHLLFRAVCTIVLPTICLFGTCGRDSGVAPATGSSITIFGINGSTPASGAAVTFYNVDEPACCPAAMLITGETGSFSTGKITSGIYSVWVEHDSGVCFQDSVIITDDFTTLRDDTLEHPASIAGVVKIEPFHDPRMLSIQALGAGKHLAEINDKGFFTVSGLAGGAWTLLIRTPQQEYLPTYRAVIVPAGIVDTITDTLRPAYNGLPAVPIASIRQDTAAGSVTVSWNRPTGCAPRDYVIYRDSCGRISMTGEQLGATTDTFFIDTTFISLPVNHRDTLSRCFIYRVAARNIVRQTGPIWGNEDISFVPKSVIAPIFSDSVRHASIPSRFASINDTVIFSVSVWSRSRTLRSLTWYDPDRRDTISILSIADSAAKTFSATIRQAFTAIGDHALHAIVVDNAGSCWTDTITVSIIADAPLVSAGKDTGVFAGEQVILHGSAKRKFGTITGWKWKIGTGEWQKTDAPEIGFPAPTTEGVVICSLSVVDDDGNTAGDAVNVFTSLKCQYVAAGNLNSFFIKSDGSLWGCGPNWVGQLGIPPDYGARLAPFRLMDNVKKISAGGERTLLLLNDGTLLRTGLSFLNRYGYYPSNNPADFLVTQMSNVQSMYAGIQNDLVVTTDGTLWASGYNTCGELGDSVSLLRDSLLPLTQNVIDAAAGFGFSIVLKTDHTAFLYGSFNCSGGYLYNQDTNGMSWEPVELLRNVQRIAASYDFCLLLQADGTLWGAGLNGYGQLGDNRQDLRTTPFTIMTGVADIALGPMFSLILKSDGTLWGCGDNFSGQLGNGTMDMMTTPIKIMSDVKNMAAGQSHTLILKNDGSVWACGSNDSGQLGDGTTDYHLVPVQIMPSRVTSDPVVMP